MRSINRVPIRLTDERWTRITTRHLEMTNEKEKSLKRLHNMEALKIALKAKYATWDYDDEADVLYVSIGKPQEGIGLDVGDSVILRYQKDSKEPIGLTILGVKSRASKLLND